MKVRYEGKNPGFCVIGVPGIWKPGTEREVTPEQWERLKGVIGMVKVEKKRTVKEDK